MSAVLPSFLQASWLLAAAAIVVFFAGTVKAVYLPLALWFEAAQFRRRKDPGLLADQPLVSIVVPAFNEAKVLDKAVASILGQPYGRIEVVLVDDGSTDDTMSRMRLWAETDERVRCVHQENGGKGAALNTGLTSCTGEIVMFVDADGVFTEQTIPEALRAFTDPSVVAVCGDDRPVNLDRIQTRFLAFISHVGTGLVRRALHLARCMPIISGNVGAFRRSVVVDLGGFRTDTVGEDLELTWRLLRHGHRVVFAPRAIVYAESPSTVSGLWRQRVRWSRGLLQALRIHGSAMFTPQRGMLGVLLMYMSLTMVLVPVLQTILLVAAIAGVVTWTGGGVAGPTPDQVWGALMWLGLVVAAFLAVVSALLDRAPRDLRHAWTIPLWPVYSVFVSLTMLRALVAALQKAPVRWNKLERTGVVSVPRVLPARAARRVS